MTRSIFIIPRPYTPQALLKSLGMFYNICMSHSSRRALFYVFLLIFLILGSGIVLFAEGWRMDFPSLRVSKVGGIYVRSYPDDARIFLSGKSVQNQSGFLSRGTLISDLFPKTYRLALTAPGFIDWHENVNVSPSLVANHKYAVLVPANATSTATGAIARFMESQSGIVLENINGAISLDGKPIGSGKLIAESTNLRSIIFQTARGTYEFENVPAGVTTNLSNILEKEGFGTAASVQLSINPTSDSMLIAASAEKIELIDMTQLSGVPIDAASRGKTIAPGVAISPTTIAWIRSANQANSSSLLFYDTSSEIVASTTIALGSPIKKLGWINGNILGILATDGSLYLYDNNQQVLKKIADDVQSFFPTMDGSRIATLESNSLEIFTLNDPTKYYRFNLPDVGNAQTALWYRDNDHLFIGYPDHVAFLDLQDASLANFTTVSAGTAPQYDQDANALYMIGPQNNLLKFSFSD